MSHCTAKDAGASGRVVGALAVARRRWTEKKNVCMMDLVRWRMDKPPGAQQDSIHEGPDWPKRERT